VKQRLNELGYSEGKNLIFDYRSAEGQMGRLPQRAAESLTTRTRRRGDRMRRRDFVRSLGAATAAWPLAARAQQPARMRRIGVLMALPETDQGAKALLLEFERGLADSGWTDGGNIWMDIRWAGGDVDLMRKFAKELVLHIDVDI
jgi:hypothetical protein